MSKFLHVSLRSRGRDQTSEWYQKNLGFEERRRGTTGIGTQTAILALPGNETYIEVSDRAKLGHDFEIPEEAILLVIQVPDLKAAIVYIKVKPAHTTKWATGSGFVFRTHGDTAYIVTNHHVIAPRPVEPPGPPPTPSTT